jgi:quinoprotein glucose dehydrogenase
MKRLSMQLALPFACLSLCTVAIADAHKGTAEDIEWRYYGFDAAGSKYSPASQINAGNVETLEVAWTWSSPDDKLAEKIRARAGYFKATPLMVGGVLYLSTSFSVVAAVDAGTGRTIWTHDPKAYEKGRPANSGWQHRGVGYWEDGSDRRIVIATGTGELVALDAATGKPIPTFGVNGSVDLQADIIRNEADRRRIGYNAATMIVRDTVVTGCTITDGTRSIDWATCPVRGWAVRSGKLKWSFNTLPKAGESEIDTWEDGSWKYAGAANAWATFSADPELGYVYVPTGTPNNDWYGGHRKGDTRHAESLLCIDVTTGKLVWSFQAVHHGLWDYDFPAAPTLADIKVDGKSIKAVAQVSKQGFTYVFDRITGEPVWPIVERPVPQSTVPGEQTSATQPFPTKPPPFVRHGMTEDDLIDFTPKLKAEALEIMKNFKMGPIFSPPTLLDENGNGGTVQVPSAAGGANWGGAGVDPKSGLLYLQASNLYMVAAVGPGKEGEVRYSITGGVALQGPGGLPITKPPYGTVTAIDLNKGTIAWQVPHGQGPTDHPRLKGLNLPPLGASSHTYLSSGGPLITSTLLFINQAQVQAGSWSLSRTERFVRAFDKSNGDVLWEKKLKLAPYGTPMTYVHQGKQYVVLAAGGGGEPSELMAFALP